MPADPLVTRHLLSLQAKAPRDLLRTPALPETGLGLLPLLQRHLAGNARSTAAAGARPVLGLPVVAAAALSAVAGDLAADRGRTPAQLPGDLPNRVASGHQGLDLASFIAGQLAAALAHDGSPWLLTGHGDCRPPAGRLQHAADPQSAALHS
ncbi:MAG: hypothetical protein OXF73_08165 [Gammaproteobacteria bacterium]|nr:hypothetical protein [Gammaproteobacteria bacterium]